MKQFIAMFAFVGSLNTVAFFVAIANGGLVELSIGARVADAFYTVAMTAWAIHLLASKP